MTATMMMMDTPTTSTTMDTNGTTWMNGSLLRTPDQMIDNGILATSPPPPPKRKNKMARLLRLSHIPSHLEIPDLEEMEMDVPNHNNKHNKENRYRLMPRPSAANNNNNADKRSRPLARRRSRVSQMMIRQTSAPHRRPSRSDSCDW